MITETQAEQLIGAMERLTQVLTMPDDELLTVEEVAGKLRRSRRYVERLMKNGKLAKVPNQGARTTRFRPADVAKLTGTAKQHGRKQT